MTSPQTLLCQRQRVTFLVPSHLCRLLSTFLHRHRPGAWSRAGPRRRRTPGSPSLPPASPAFLSHILPTRILSQEVRGCWPGASWEAHPPVLECMLTAAFLAGKVMDSSLCSLRGHIPPFRTLLLQGLSSTCRRPLAAPAGLAGLGRSRTCPCVRAISPPFVCFCCWLPHPCLQFLLP